MNFKTKSVFIPFALSIILSGCASDGNISGESGSGKIDTGTPLPGSRYSMKNDAYPESDIDVSSIPNAVPTNEPYSRGGNRSTYQVWGKSYNVLKTHQGYSEEGGASWYGRKFHGHKTSNGEIYDMYGMTAAHKSLPIPSYVKVRNLENNKEVIVRVNDRGPFHSDRIIDLSYAAAKKLGYKDKGTANVSVTSISVSESGAYSIPEQKRSGFIETKPLNDTKSESFAKGDYFVQVGSFSNEARAKSFEKEVKARLGMGVYVRSDGRGLLARHKVVVGPLSNRDSAEKNLDTIKRQGFFGAFISTN